MVSFLENINNLLVDIQEPQLTDQEIETINPTDPESLQELFDTTYKILRNRGGTKNTFDKLFFEGLKVNIKINKSKKNYSNILIGFGL